MYKSFELGLEDAEKWQTYLDKIPDKQKDIYFSPEYYRLYENLGDGTAKCFVFTDGERVALYPYLLNEVNREKYNLTERYLDIQGAYGYNGAVYNSFDTDFVTAFNRTFEEHCLSNKVLAEFTRFHPLLENKHFFASRMNIIDDRETVFLNLSQDIDELWKDQFSSAVRNKIRKAQNRGYSSEVLRNPKQEDLETFLRIYKENMEMVGADDYFLFNKKYFEDTFKYLKTYSYLLNIKDDKGEMISSTILFKYGEYFHYHLSGRTKKAISWASNFLYSESIKLAKEEGAAVYHFGGGRSGAKDDSLLRFKKGFSNSSSVFALGKKIYYPEVYAAIENQWNNENPEKKDDYKNYLLKYRVEKPEKSLKLKTVKQKML